MTLLLDALSARSGIVCAVGAGGKKTTLYHLASVHPGRVGLTCTVPNTYFPDSLGAHEVIAEPHAIVSATVEAAASQRFVAFACPSEKKGRYGGVDAEQLAEIQAQAGFDVLFVKCDGARVRWIKAPAANEPVIPSGATTVIPILSAKAIGERLSAETAHRPDLVQAVSGAEAGERITAGHVARLLAHEQGALKNTGEALVLPIINMVDDIESEAAATEAAKIALDLTDRFDRVALTSSLRPNRLVKVVDR